MGLAPGRAACQDCQHQDRDAIDQFDLIETGGGLAAVQIKQLNLHVKLGFV
jgi:hypothetical protein